MSEKTKIYERCHAGATKCDYKRNSDIGVVICALGTEAKDSHGNPCPHRKQLKVVI